MHDDGSRQAAITGFEDGPGQAPLPAAGGDAFALQRERIRAAGGFTIDLPHHVISWLPGRGERLVVCFDNLTSVRETVDRHIWGERFLAGRGFDLLGVQIRRVDWFRDADLIAALERLRDDGFFARFRQVAFYGASMGGFGALAFAPLAPGCTVLAFAPQRSLDRTLCPFETRYRYARNVTDWTLPYSDAAAGVQAAGHVHIAFDPKLDLDRRHAAMLTGPRVMLLPMPHLGHKLPPALLKMGVLKDLSLAALENRLDPPGFARLMRARRNSVPWCTDLLDRARAAGHLRLGLRLAESMVAANPHWRLRQARRELVRALRADRR